MSSSYWSPPNRDNDNPFEKYKSQRNATTDLPGFRARRRSHSKSRAMKVLGALFVLGVLLFVWRGSESGALFGLDSLDGNGEHIAAKGTEPIRHRTAEKAVENNVQIGKERASLVMLVRYACFFSFRHQHCPVLFLAEYQLIMHNTCPETWSSRMRSRP